MKNERQILDKAIGPALTGEGAHVEAEKVVAGLDWRVAGARPEKAVHSIYQILGHIIYWQEWVLKWLKGKSPAIPKHASGSWPGKVRPRNEKEWEQAVSRFREGISELRRLAQGAELFSRNGQKSKLEMFHTIASHNSYHLGQIVLLRQMLGNWPPPSGGLTW